VIDTRQTVAGSRAELDMRAAGMMALSLLVMLLVSGRSLDLLGSPARMALLLGSLAVAATFWLSGQRWTTYAYFALVLPSLIAVPALATGWLPGRGISTGDGT
jgi:hypothetical protein